VRTAHCFSPTHSERAAAAYFQGVDSGSTGAAGDDVASTSQARIEALREEIAALKEAIEVLESGPAANGDAASGGDAGSGGEGADGDGDGDESKADTDAANAEVARLKKERLLEAEVCARMCVSVYVCACVGVRASCQPYHPHLIAGHHLAIVPLQQELAELAAKAEEDSAKAVAESRARDKAVRYAHMHTTHLLLGPQLNPVHDTHCCDAGRSDRRSSGWRTPSSAKMLRSATSRLNSLASRLHRARRLNHSRTSWRPRRKRFRNLRRSWRHKRRRLVCL